MESDSLRLHIDKISSDHKRAQSAPAHPIPDFDTSVKALNDAIVRAEFRNLTAETLKPSLSGNPVPEPVIKDEETPEGLSSTDDEPFLLDQQAIREILEENRRLKEQLEQLLKS